MTSEAEELLASEAGESAERMALVVDIKDVGPCRKHVTVTVPESDIEEIREQCLEDLSVKAQVPGFRIGRAPRELLLRRFRDEITAEIKQKVLLASLD
ncbi:MAG: trigger factor family protein, partial [Phycisphaerae bacterium]